MIVIRLYFLLKSSDGAFCFLDRVRVPLPVRPIAPISLIAGGNTCVIDPEDGDANRFAVLGSILEMIDLLEEITSDTINLFDHGFREDLYFNADLNRCDRTSRHVVTRDHFRGFVGDEFTEGAIAASRLNACPLIRDINDSCPRFYPGDILQRSIDGR